MVRGMSSKATAVLLCMLLVIATAPFSASETLASRTLGAVITGGRVTVDSAVAPTGTTIFSGDRVVANEAPALINLFSGSRVELTRAAASFARDGEYLTLQASTGLLRFNFRKGETVRINAGPYTFTSVGTPTAHVGELGSNSNGQVVMTVSEGVFAVVNHVSGERSEVTLTHPLVVMEQGGQGSLSKGGKTLTDTSKSWQPNELKGKCVVAGGEAYPIVGNTANTLTIKGAWKLTTGKYDYKITDCTKDAMIAAGASAASAGAAASAAGTAAAAGAAAAGAGAGAGGGIAAATVAIAAAAGATGAGFAINNALTEDKSPSTR